MQNHHLPIPLNPGYRLQNWYEIGHVLGRGNCGITYQAYDRNLERTVAIKEYLPAVLALRDSGVFVQPSAAFGEDAYHIGLETFLEEARILAKVENPSLPGIINVFMAHNTAYMVMSHEEGESLESILQRRRTLEEAELLLLLMPLLGALEKLHEAGHLHGDLKPAHILVRSDGSPVLVDFGAARRMVAELTHSVCATPGYSAPEAYFGKKEQLGAGADIYGLAAILYRAVAGVAPPDALERSRSMIGESQDPLIPCIQVGGQRYSEGLLRTIDCALRLDAGERPRTIAAWRREFGSSPGGPRDPLRTRADAAPAFSAPPRRPRRDHPTGRSPAKLIAGSLSAAALLLLGIVVWLHRHDQTAGADSVRHEPAAQAGAVPAPPVPVASEQEKALAGKVAALLAGARADLENGRLFTPNEDNALAKYKAALALEPGLPEARQGLRRIADELLRKSHQAMDKRDWSRAQQYLDEAGSVLPDLENLAAARKELHARMLEPPSPPQESAHPSGLAAKAAQLATVARRAMKRRQWEKAQSDIDRIAAFMPNWEELPALRQELQEARGETAPAEAPGENPADGSRQLQDLLKRARHAMERRRWDKAQDYIDKAQAIDPQQEDAALLQNELNTRLAEEQKSAEPQQATQVRIRSANVSMPVAQPGQTLEFETEYVLDLGPGESERQVTATWALTRNGHRVGKEGATSMPVKAGVHTTTTELLLPPYMKEGTYVVEHRVNAGSSHDAARSNFRVQR